MTAAAAIMVKSSDAKSSYFLNSWLHEASGALVTTILLVDDEESIRSSVEKLLRLEGYVVMTAPDGRAGLNVALEKSPDLVLTDVHMPLMDGFSMLYALRQLDRFVFVPVIMLTAAEDNVNVRRAMTAGADDFICKPFAREDLLGSIKAQLDKVSQRRRNLASRR
jgi:DNA-binding response OmpR family regulator